MNLMLRIRISLVAVAIVAALASATVTLAGDRALGRRQSETPRQALTVPDLRDQVYVFAKGMLLDAGFAWRVEGPVRGYAANLVASQSPAAGTKLRDTGAPTLVLRLSRSAAYRERGRPEDRSPYSGTRVVQADRPAVPVRAAAESSSVPARQPDAPARRPVVAPARQPVSSARAGRPRSATERTRANAHRATARTHTAPRSRPPAFVRAGAPPEPLDEISLPERARRVDAWLAKRPAPTDRTVRHWLFQHEWILSGARFGWWHGAEALRILIRADGRAIDHWGIGTRSRARARAVLAKVEARGR